MVIQLEQAQAGRLAAQLPDDPETVIAASQMRANRARVWVDAWPAWQTAVVEDLGQPGEPMLFGQPAAWPASLFAGQRQWTCLNAAAADAAAMQAFLEAGMQRPFRPYDDVYHTLTASVAWPSHPSVRRLTAADLPLLYDAPPLLRGADPRRLVHETMAAGAVIDGLLAAVAHNYALSEKFGDVGVATLPAYRGRGLAVACAALVAAWLQQNGRIPVWSCGEGNRASLRVAQKLGFTEYSRRVYLILDERFDSKEMAA